MGKPHNPRMDIRCWSCKAPEPADHCPRQCGWYVCVVCGLVFGPKNAYFPPKKKKA